MLKVVLLALYYWLSILFFWHGRYARAGIGDKPLILSSVYFSFVFNILSLVWLVATGYLLFVVDWKLVVAAFIVGFAARFISLIEDLALLPFDLVIRKLERVARKRNSDL